MNTSVWLEPFDVPLMLCYGTHYVNSPYAVISEWHSMKVGYAVLSFSKTHMQIERSKIKMLPMKSLLFVSAKLDY